MKKFTHFKKFIYLQNYSQSTYQRKRNKKFKYVFLAKLELPEGLEADHQVPTHNPVPLSFGDKGLKPVQQHLCCRRISSFIDAIVEGVRVIGG